jgi:glycosyltransferase involved in cell wall biosynthesis
VSLLRKTYYHVKPWLPAQVRLAARRRLARHVLSTAGASWPIKRGSQFPPNNWPGWPDGKKFAFVLTHDVESRKGLDRSLQLADLEANLGFRSSFNFIPEGTYSVPPATRATLTSRGFEIGVHDLHHDGKLYRSREGFRAHAQRINSYLGDWNAIGFRSGFMHHNIDWLHDLDIAYDMSTFDTDPFEPQPDGVETIFPFWVPHPVPSHENATGRRENGRGYVELPYTLTQDSTLFLLFERTSTEIWKEKLDWIARHGGMALLNVHPDYISFAGDHTTREYPVALYENFLRYVRERYAKDAWFALPRDVARFAAAFRPVRPSLSSKRVCMISYSFYKSDNRVMRYAEALANRGDTVDVIALAKPGADRFEAVNGVSLYRIQRRERNEKSKFDYLARIIRFLLSSSALLTWKHLRKRYDVIHVHNVPDFLVFAAWLPRLTGSRIILDIHDLLPEFFASKFAGSSRAAWYVDRLIEIERASCRFAHHVIISNHLWLKKITARSVEPHRCTALVNHVDSEVFYPRARTRTDDRLIAIFPGGLQAHQGLDVAIRAFKLLVPALPKAEFHIYGEGNMKDEWMALTRELGLEKHIYFFKPLPLHEIAEKIANADVGLVPKLADSFGNEAYSTKIMEFMSQGVPVVASRTKIDTFYFNDSQIAFFESGNAEDLAQKMIRVFQDRACADRLAANGLAYVARNNWDSKKGEYFAIVDNATSPVSSPLKGIASSNTPQLIQV